MKTLVSITGFHKCLHMCTHSHKHVHAERYLEFLIKYISVTVLIKFYSG